MNKKSLPQPPIDKSMLGKSVFTYVIIDCALFEEEFYQTVIKNPTVTAESLFIGTLDEDSAIAGPLLVKLDLENNKEFIEKLQKIEQEKPAIVWLWSEMDFLKLSETVLKPSLYGELENGMEILLRYYDPRCLEVMLDVLKEDKATAKRLANIKAWAISKDGQYSYLV